MNRSGFFIRATAATLDNFLIGLIGTMWLVGGYFIIVGLRLLSKEQVSDFLSVSGIAHLDVQRLRSYASNIFLLSLPFTVLVLSLTAVGILYTLTEVFFAGTPGKAILGMRIGDKTGIPAT